MNRDPIDDLNEMPAARRKRILEEGRGRAVADAREMLAAHFSALGEAFEASIVAAYRTGLDAQADILQPEVTAGEIGHELRPVKIEAATMALAINGVIRLMLTARTEFALGKRFDGNVLLPRAEAVAMSAVVEAALGLNTEKLLESDLFDKLP